jgi:hypothetical protein
MRVYEYYSWSSFLTSHTTKWNVGLNKWYFHELPVCPLCSCAQYILLYRNRSTRCYSNSPYLVHVQVKSGPAAIGTQTKFPRRWLLSNKPASKPSAPTPIARRRAPRCVVYRRLPSNGLLCINQKSSATPTRPSVSPSFRHTIPALQPASLTTRLPTELHLEQLLRILIFWIIYWGPQTALVCLILFNDALSITYVTLHLIATQLWMMNS